MSDHEDNFERAQFEMRIYHGHLLARLTNTDSRETRKLRTYSSKLEAVEKVLQTLDAIEEGRETIDTELADEFQALSDARLTAVTAAADIEDDGEQDRKGAGVY